MTANVRDALSAAARRQIPIFRATGPVRSEALFLDISLFYFCFYFFFCYKVDASCIRVDAGGCTLHTFSRAFKLPIDNSV